MNSTQQKEVVALVTWLQTFPEFGVNGVSLIPEGTTHVAVEALVKELDTIAVVRAVENVATFVMNGEHAVEAPEDGSKTASEQIWISLLILTSTRARPTFTQEQVTDSLKLKLTVLANLLDCSVQNPDLRQRRVLIERIMALPKTHQKALMSLIERRSGGKSGSSSNSNSPNRNTPVRNTTPTRTPSSKSTTPLKSAMKQPGSTSRTNTPPRLERTNTPPRPERSSSASPGPTPGSTSSTRFSSPMGSRVQNQQKSGSRSRSSSLPPTSGPKVRIQTDMALTSTSNGSAQKLVQQQQQFQHQQYQLQQSNSNNTPMSPASSHTTQQCDNTTASATVTRLLSSSLTQTQTHTQGNAHTHTTPPRTTTAGSSRKHSNAFFDASPSGHTPEPKRSSMSASTSATPSSYRPRSASMEQQLLSPGIMESPGQIQSVVADLKHRNEQLQDLLQQSKAQEEEHRRTAEVTVQAHRKEMIQLEAAAMDRQEEIQFGLEEKIGTLEAHLQVAEADSAKGQVAMQELAIARDELDLMNHSREVLHETTEKLRKYKDKVAELLDVKEALDHEQDAHGQSIDEVVRLENELQALAPLKRQLDDYKIRAIEAEVKLVETQDYLRRLEQQASDQNARNEHLWKGAAMQQEQVEELQRRIQQETQASMDDDNDDNGGNGVGDGVSELNPEIQRELFRLRNENLQLRAFAAKRESDGVQKLEENLDDTKRLADRYKDNYLSAKTALEEMQVVLTETQQRESKLVVEVDQWRERSDLAETRTRLLEEKLDQEREHLERVRRTLSETEIQNSNLHREIDEWKEQLTKAESASSQRYEQLQAVLKELKETQNERTATEQVVQELRATVSAWEVHSEEIEAAENKASQDLQRTQELLTETRVTLAETQRRETSLLGQVKKIQDESEKLQECVEEERQAKHEAIEDAHNSLEATRTVLNSKWEKDMEALRVNMNQLLEEERRAYRHQSEETEQKYLELETKWNQEYTELQERSTSSVKHLREEAQEKFESVQKEHQVEIKKIKGEAEEAQNTLIRKGRTMINEAKAKAKEALQLLDDECKTLEEQQAVLTKDKQETEHLLRNKISSLKQKIEFTANQINDLTRDGDDFQEKVKTLEREKFKLQEDNDRYRRQLGGSYGADGKSKAQLETLQREYNAMLEENRNLKKQTRHGGVNSLGSIGEFDMNEEESHGYSRGGVNRTTLSQMRQEYEEQLESLNDEKRELIMKNSAASTDVQKAEQRAWEREQEVAKLKEDITSLKLAQQRAEFSLDRSMDAGREKELSFFSAHDEERSPGYPTTVTSGGHQGTPGGSPGFDRSRSAAKNASPGITRALQKKAEREHALLSKLSSMTGSPNRKVRSLDLIALDPNAATAEYAPQVLTPSRRPSNEANMRQESPTAKLAADVFGLQTGDKASRSPPASNSTGSQKSKTLMDCTQVDESRLDFDGRPECNQS